MAFNVKIADMPLGLQIAKQIRDVHFGGNWTASSMKDQLAHISWERATRQTESFNTIAVLVFHMHYFVDAVLRVLEGKKLNASDKLSFNAPEINSEIEWQALLERCWRNAERFASLVEQIPDNKFYDVFEDDKYGDFYRNITGVVEHIHYHLGQIVILKKINSK